MTPHAEIMDFELVRSADMDLLYRFRFAPWKCEDFPATLEAFKAAIPLVDRKPYPDRDWLWEIGASRPNRAALAAIFSNFENSYLAAVSQLPLWPD